MSRNTQLITESYTQFYEVSCSYIGTDGKHYRYQRYEVFLIQTMPQRKTHFVMFLPKPVLLETSSFTQTLMEIISIQQKIEF